MAGRSNITARGIYGGAPEGKLSDFGVNAICLNSGALTTERVAQLKAQGATVYAEFNSMHHAAYLEKNPDAAPVGPDGKVCPPPDGWQGVCPTHSGYRRDRMDAFRAVLRDFAIDGIWLDYHHSHASWEQAVPNLPDTCFCAHCLGQFRTETGIRLPDEPTPETSRRLLGDRRREWGDWRCDVFTEWVREYHDIRDAVRPSALLGTFHCPWSDTDNNGALRDKLAIDLRAQAKYIDIFSTMPYHARFGHATDPEWISRQVNWLGKHLGVRGTPGERHRIWPIVQLSDWGETVSAAEVQAVLEHGTRLPATGVFVFAWGSLHPQRDKVKEMAAFFRAIAP
jgi:hypothetical protein